MLCGILRGSTLRTGRHAPKLLLSIVVEGPIIPEQPPHPPRIFRPGMVTEAHTAELGLLKDSEVSYKTARLSSAKDPAWPHNDPIPFAW